MIDQPHVEDQAHSTYATEFASSVMGDVLPMLGVYKNDSSGGTTKVQLPSTKTAIFRWKCQKVVTAPKIIRNYSDRLVVGPRQRYTLSNGFIY